jgi:hypothetical protein
MRSSVSRVKVSVTPLPKVRLATPRVIEVGSAVQEWGLSKVSP